MNNIIIETDLGHDPDDYFAILYLIATGKNIPALFINPGDPDQIAIARFIVDELKLKTKIYSAKKDRTKRSSGSIHHKILKKYNKPLDVESDGLGIDCIQNFENSDLFIIGPCAVISTYLSQNPNAKFGKATMQGGFCPYKLYRPNNVLDKFENRDWNATFNLNGCRKIINHFLDSKHITRQMVGKNICHTVYFTNEIFKSFNKPNSRAAELFCEGTRLLGGKSKKFHDPTAAVCHLHPEIGTWYKGKTIKMDGGWTTIPDDNGDNILVDINYNEMWKYMGSWI